MSGELQVNYIVLTVTLHYGEKSNRYRAVRRRDQICPKSQRTRGYLRPLARVDPIWTTDRLVTLDEDTLLETAWRGLNFSLRPGQVERGQVRVKCVASYPKLYWKSSEVVLQVVGAEGLAGASGYNSQGFALTDIAHPLDIAPVLLFLPCLHFIVAFF
ncbi:uncharacterized protein LOC134765012 [Penaeus indicus]|uniref:uncharacterized protein LOC134765012 n=1 Tax=Penaeus indicus TaxID=29960 RepID=UPI00300D51D5